MRALSVALLAVATGTAPAALAQSEFPYELDTSREVVLTATGLGSLLAAAAVQDAQEPFTPSELAQLDPADVNAFDRGATRQWSAAASTAADILTFTLVLSPVALAAVPSERRQSWTIGLMYLQTVLINNGVVQLVKGLTERTRPYAYNDDPEIPEELRFEVDARRSYPSGHTANAFAAAVFLSSTYAKLKPQSSARVWIWVGSLTAAATVGYLRYSAGKHFPTDILSGAAWGATVGYLVPKLHEVSPVQIVPSGEGVGVGVFLRH